MHIYFVHCFIAVVVYTIHDLYFLDNHNYNMSDSDDMVVVGRSLESECGEVPSGNEISLEIVEDDTNKVKTVPVEDSFEREDITQV